MPVRRPLRASHDVLRIQGLVRKGGFEPPRSCERQPLKLVRLPVPPLPQPYFCVPVGAVGPDFAGVIGAVGAGRGADDAGVPLISEPGPRCPMIASASAPNMNSTDSTHVA